ncbi:murein transglycosylase A [Microbaculum marinum]|uniref:peptidoglycan lytic exotransglycosylase n=1 Tax=Microbaculum marinum TaxID=1764581 RepID=A0AAW9S475_9HYPH
MPPSPQNNPGIRPENGAGSNPAKRLVSRFTERPHWRRELGIGAAAVVLAAGVALFLVAPRQDRLVSDHPISKAGHRLVGVGFSDIPGFLEDDHAAALRTFLRSCAQGDNDGGLANACLKALAISDPSDPDTAEAFFTANFRPYRIEPEAGEGLVTAYYEPVVPGSRVRTEAFTEPLYALPPDFVRITDDNRPEGWDEELSWGRMSEAGLVPAPTRAEIDAGALEGRAEPIVYVADLIEAFYIHIQGSTRIALPDGTMMRVGFAGKNGHPYSSVGKVMQARGIVPSGGFSMDGMRAHFREDLDQARSLIHENESYIFFREIRDLAPELGPIGGEGVPLTAGRSIAVDTAFHAYGTPVYIDSSPQIGPKAGGLRTAAPFRRLMIAQDTGSAIRGPARADLFWGTGPEAGSMAGGIKADGTFYVLLPKS